MRRLRCSPIPPSATVTSPEGIFMEAQLLAHDKHTDQNSSSYVRGRSCG